MTWHGAQVYELVVVPVVELLEVLETLLEMVEVWMLLQ